MIPQKGMFKRFENAKNRQTERKERMASPEHLEKRAAMDRILREREEAMEAESARERDAQGAPARAVVAALAERFGGDFLDFGRTFKRVKPTEFARELDHALDRAATAARKQAESAREAERQATLAADREHAMAVRAARLTSDKKRKASRAASTEAVSA